MCQLSPVEFHGDTIFCVEQSGQPFTPMKPIVENLGLGWASQSQKLNANKQRWGVTIIVIPSESGDQRTLCLPLRKLPAWFASIQPKKVKPELRAKIELYQNECDDALWNYWINGRAERQPEPPQADNPDSPIGPADQNTLQAIVRAKVAEMPESSSRGGFPQIWSRFNNHFRIAKYCQLPQSKMSEAVEYLVKLEVREKKELPPSQPLFPSGIQSSIPGPQPGDKYYAYLEKVEKWRVATVAERENLYREGVALFDVGRMGGEMFHVCADYLLLWLKNGVLASDTSVFDELLRINCAPVILAKFLNTNFESVEQYLK